MATERQLRRRIRDLQNQIESLGHQRDTFQNDMIRQTNDRMEQFKREYETALKRQKNETEELYTARLRAFQEQAANETKRRYDELRRTVEETADKQTKLLNELSECNEELRRLLRKVKQQTEEMDDAHRARARELMSQVEERKSDTDVTPHEFFFNGEFQIIDSHAVQIKDEIEQCMFQSAAADASSVMMEFELLKIKVEQAFREWLSAYQDYSAIVHEIAQRIGVLESQHLKTAAGSFKMSETELNFWSSGTYIPFKEKIKKAEMTVWEIEEKGAVKYLKENRSSDRKGIFASVSEAHKWSDELSGIINCILSERMLSDERWVIGRNAAKVLAASGYSEISKGFRQKDASLKDKKWYPKDKKIARNPLDCFDLIETIQGADRIQITLVPVRENGLAVRNECIVSLSAQTLQDQALTMSIVEINVQRVQNTASHIRVSGIMPDADQLQRVLAEEQRRKKKPDPQIQIRHIERKYH